jgi:hypothetical protein
MMQTHHSCTFEQMLTAIVYGEKRSEYFNRVYKTEDKF